MLPVQLRAIIGQLPHLSYAKYRIYGAGSIFDDLRRSIDLFRHPLDRLCSQLYLLARLAPVALLDRLSPPREGLYSVTGVEAWGIDLVFEPGTAWQPLFASQFPLALHQESIQL